MADEKYISAEEAVKTMLQLKEVWKINTELREETYNDLIYLCKEFNEFYKLV